VQELPNLSEPIGVFDSGVGGTSVLRHLRELLPHEDLLYLADQANCPYGARPIDELQALSAVCARWLIDRGATVVVVACNTASAAALQWLRGRFPATPFVGMVPAVKPAAAQTRTGVVGVLATPTTIRGELLDEVVLRWAGGTTVVRQACPGLVEQIEAGELDTAETHALLATYLRPLLDAGADTMLGCTHYPFLAPQIQRIAGPGIALIDAAPAVARQTARVLAERRRGQPTRTRAGRTVYATTGSPRDLTALLYRLGLPPGDTVHAHISMHVSNQ
jgi:glutamate racemase